MVTLLFLRDLCGYVRVKWYKMLLISMAKIHSLMAVMEKSLWNSCVNKCRWWKFMLYYPVDLSTEWDFTILASFCFKPKYHYRSPAKIYNSDSNCLTATFLIHQMSILWGFSFLTLKVLNFWKFTSYCSLKPLWLGMGEVVPARTSPTLHPPSPPTVHQLSQLAL